jgi:hypothetical protein
MLGLSHTSAIRPKELALRLTAIAAVLFLGSFLARTYFGHSSSPYGVCYGSSGRSVPCSLVAQSNHRPPNER